MIYLTSPYSQQRASRALGFFGLATLVFSAGGAVLAFSADVDGFRLLACHFK